MPITPNTTILNKYRIVRPLGEGGMARVWLAEELAFGQRLVAIKEPRPNPLSDDATDITLRYRREVQVCAAMEQAGVPHIVRAITAEPTEDGLLLVMTYMPGGDLAQLIRQHPAGLPVERAVAIALDVLTALAGAHSHPMEIVHRDVKPSNILFDDQERAFLADFGLAQLAGVSGRSQLRGSQHPGTPQYMAPEQERSAGYLSPAADLYALGCVLWEMLAGKRYKRFKPGTPPSQVRGDVPSWLDQVLVKALAEEPWERWGEVEEMVEAVRTGRAAPRAQSVPPVAVQPAPRQPAQVAAPLPPPPVTPQPPIWQQIGIELVRIPAGEFLMGSDAARDRNTRYDEIPQHSVFLPDYELGRTPVTVAQFTAFVETTGYQTTADKQGSWTAQRGFALAQRKGVNWRRPRGVDRDLEMEANHPVVQVTWRDAQAFCEWAGLRLPTEAEWEKGARGTDGRIFPWGFDAADDSRCNFSNYRESHRTTSVDQYVAGMSPYGLLDMVGNVWDWCADWYDAYYYAHSPRENPLGPNRGSMRVLRGGSWGDYAQSVRAAVRYSSTPDGRSDIIGFRPARSP